MFDNPYPALFEDGMADALEPKGGSRVELVGADGNSR